MEFDEIFHGFWLAVEAERARPGALGHAPEVLSLASARRPVAPDVQRYARAVLCLATIQLRIAECLERLVAHVAPRRCGDVLAAAARASRLEPPAAASQPGECAVTGMATPAVDLCVLVLDGQGYRVRRGPLCDLVMRVFAYRNFARRAMQHPAASETALKQEFLDDEAVVRAHELEPDAAV